MSFNNDYVSFHGECITSGLFAEVLGHSKNFLSNDPERFSTIAEFLRNCDARSFLDRFREIRAKRRESGYRNRAPDVNSQYKDSEWFKRTGISTKAELRKCMKCDKIFPSRKGRRICNDCKTENDYSTSSFMAEYI